MASVRTAASCIGVAAPFSIMRDFLGFRSTRVPKGPPGDAVSGAPAVISLKDHLSRLRGHQIDINLIYLRSLSSDESDVVDAGVHKCRAIYAQVGLTIARVRHRVPDGDASAYVDIDSRTEADALRGGWSGPANAIDVFVVNSLYGNVVGQAGAIGGSCDKTQTSGTDGVIAAIADRSANEFARTFAHEIGHFLKLPHTCGEAPACKEPCDLENLMTQSGCDGVNVATAVKLVELQAILMLSHCSVEPGCSL